MAHDAAHKTLWGFLEQLAPLAPQEITRRAEADERYATIDGWLHIRGRWFWHIEHNVLMRGNRQFIAAFHRVANAGDWDV